MPKITVEVPENCYYCKLRDRHMCNYFSKRVGIPFTEDTFERCPECLAAELPEPEEVYCEWRERDTEIDADKLYNTSCGKTSVMLAGGGYCNHCGRKRKIKQEVVE